VKIKFDELKKALTWIETNTQDISMNITIDTNIMTIRTFDKYESEVIIEIFDDGIRTAKIKRTDAL